MIAQRNRGLKAYCRKMEENCEALEGADALAIVTEWKAFRVPDFARMAELLRDRAVFDGRNLYPPELPARYGLHYVSIGRPVPAAQGLPSGRR